MEMGMQINVMSLYSKIKEKSIHGILSFLPPHYNHVTVVS